MKKKKLIWQIPFLLILIIGSIFVIRQQRNTPFQKDEGMVFGTIYHITYQSDTNYQKEIEAELQKVDNSLSPFNKTSIISRVNRNEKVKVDAMFSEVFPLAEKISGETDGAFDITVAPMVMPGGSVSRPATLLPDRPSTVCVPSWDSTTLPCRMVTSSRRIRRRCSTVLPLPRDMAPMW